MSDAHRAGPRLAACAALVAVLAGAPSTAQPATAPADAPPMPTTEPHPVVSTDPAVRSLPPPVRVRPGRPLVDRRERLEVSYPTFDLGDEAASADLAARVEAFIYGAALSDYGYSRGRCRATLATTELVSILCEYRTLGERGAPPRPEAYAVTYRLRGGTARAIDVDEAFVPEASIEAAICARARPSVPEHRLCYPVAVAFGPRGLEGRVTTRGQPARRITIPYADVAHLIRADGPLGFAHGPAPARPSETARAAIEARRFARPRCAYFGPARTPAELARAAVGIDLTNLTVHLDAMPDGRFRFATTLPRSITPTRLDGLLRAFGERADGPCPETAAALRTDLTTAPAALRASPTGEVVATVPAQTPVVLFVGLVDGFSTAAGRLPAAQLRFVVTAEAAGFTRDPSFRGY